MKRTNLFAVILVAPTLFYGVMIITNPAGIFGEPSEKLLALQHITDPYHGKAAAIQLPGTTLIAIGIIASQERRSARMVSPLGTAFIWVGLMFSIRENLLLVSATLAIFAGSMIMQVIYVIISKLMQLSVKVALSIAAAAARLALAILHTVRAIAGKIARLTRKGISAVIKP